MIATSSTGHSSSAQPWYEARSNRRTFAIVASFAVFSGIWIYCSDYVLVRLFSTPEAWAQWSIYKGLAFVIVTSFLLWLLIRRALAEMEAVNRRLHQQQAALARSEGRLHSIVASAADAIIVVDGDGLIVLLNPAAQSLFGRAEEDARGQALTQLVAKLPITTGATWQLTQARRHDGRTIPVEVMASAFATEQGSLTTLFLRDVSEFLAQQSEIRRLSRLYAALSHVNQAIVRIDQRLPLYESICRALVEQGGFGMAWIGEPEPRSGAVQAVVQAGKARDASSETDVARVPQSELDAATEALRQCIRQIHPGDPSVAAASSYAVFPIRCNQKVVATLGVCSIECDYFQDREVELLEEVAGDTGFALANMARENDRRRAEAVAQRETLFSAAMIECMPGIVYFYDDVRRFLRWNRNFEIASGYSGEQIASMHPLQFFDESEKPAMEQRIAEVFEKGEAFLEATFVARDGTRTPYYFTGRKVYFEGQPCLVGMGVDISQRKRAEQAHARLAAIVDSSHDAIIGKTLDGVITSWNPAAETIFGYSAEEAIGNDVARFVPPELRAEELDHRLRIARGEAVEHFETERIRAAGDRIDVAITISPIVDERGHVVGASSIAQDISARKAAEHALRASEERYRSTLDTILEGCQLLDFDWRYLYVNDASAIQNRQSKDDMLGRSMFEVWPGIAHSALYRLLSACMDDRCARHEEIEVEYPDGSRGWFDVRCQPVTEGVFVLSIDISERKRAETRLRELNETLESRVIKRTDELHAAVVRAEAADRIKSAFLATMSHELRTPLNSIIGFTGIILQGLAGPLNAEQQRQLGMVRVSARHLLELINDVLDLSKIEAGQLEVRAEDFDVAVSVNHVIALVQPLADKKALNLTVTLDPSISTLCSDRRRVEQILINLLNNAVKFTVTGKVALDVVRLADVQADSGVVEALQFRVSDTGIGMRPEDIATLFLPFRQLDNGLTRLHEGTGLGLVICRRLAELLQGRVDVSSEWETGSVFSLTLPTRSTG